VSGVMKDVQLYKAKEKVSGQFHSIGFRYRFPIILSDKKSPLSIVIIPLPRYQERMVAPPAQFLRVH
jgi:hypothetical protein